MKIRSTLIGLIFTSIQLQAQIYESFNELRPGGVPQGWTSYGVEASPSAELGTPTGSGMRSDHAQLNNYLQTDTVKVLSPGKTLSIWYRDFNSSSPSTLTIQVTEVHTQITTTLAVIDIRNTNGTQWAKGTWTYPSTGEFVITFGMYAGPQWGNRVCIDGFESTASWSNPPDVLPLNFTSLNLESLEGKVHLFLTTADEENVHQLYAEHSTDGITFYPFAQVNANNKIQNSYTLTHFSPIQGLNYYRFYSIDQDGSLQFSNILVTEIDIQQMKAYPSLWTEGDLTISVPNNDGILTLSDLMGMTYWGISVEKGNGPISISRALLNPGVYLIRFTDVLGQSQSQKIIVE